MSDATTIRANLITRWVACSAEIAASEDGDANEYLMRRYEELAQIKRALADLDLLTETTTELPGPYEIITQGET